MSGPANLDSLGLEMKQPPNIPLTLQRHPEEVLHRAVVDYLRGVWIPYTQKYIGAALPAGAVLHHSPNGGRRSKAEGGVFKALGTHAGWPDLEICYRSRVYFIELKSAARTLSPAQRACHIELETAGMPVAICRSLEEVEGTLTGWGIPLTARVPVTGRVS